MLMESTDPARVLFDILDERLEEAAKEIKNRVFSAYRDVSWTPEQRKLLRPLVRKELDVLMQGFFALLDNVGSVLPEGVLAYRLISVADKDIISVNGAGVILENDEDFNSILRDQEDFDDILQTLDQEDYKDIRYDHADYEMMWLNYLADKALAAAH